MKQRIVWLLFVFGVSGFCQPPSPASADEAAAAITRLREGLVTSFNKGDVEGLLTYLDPDVVVTWQNGEICRGPEAIRAFYARMMTGDKRVVREIKSEPEVLGRHVYGDWAVSWGNLHDHFVLTDGSDLPFDSVFTATIAKRGDRWLVTAFHTSVSAFENPVLTLATRKTALWSGIGGGAVGLLIGAVGAHLLGRKKDTA
jgi:ketosteroid isomerase-like protein